MKKIKTLLLTVCILMFVSACHKDKKVDQPVPVAHEEVLDAEMNAEIAAMPNLNIDLNSIVLRNGMNLMDFELKYDLEWLTAHKDKLPERYKKLLDSKLKTQAAADKPVSGPLVLKDELFARALIEAQWLVTDSNFTELVKDKPAPAQLYGLAYSYNSKDYGLLQKPLGCPELLYGLDCSGMLADIINTAEPKMNFITGASANQGTAAAWVKALSNAGPEYAKLVPKNYTSEEIGGKFESGDVLYFYSKKTGNIVHIGIALAGPNGTINGLYQSNADPAECDKNYGEKKGPRLIATTGPATWKSIKGYGVLRVTVNISGKWRLFLKCADQQNVAITIDPLTIPATNGGGFTATGSGTDYDGSPIETTLNGNYDPKTATLSGTFTFRFPNTPSQNRQDKFTTTLQFDDTGYFGLTKVVNNGGCDGAIRLINLDSKNVPTAVKTSITSNSNQQTHSYLHN